MHAVVHSHVIRGLAAVHNSTCSDCVEGCESMPVSGTHGKNKVCPVDSSVCGLWLFTPPFCGFEDVSVLL